MAKKKWKYWLTGLLILCGGIILAGGIYYVSSLREDLMNQTVENVLTVTQQQQQAFDNFISGDRERLHSYAEYFSKISSKDTESIRDQLKVFGEVDAFYTVINLSDGSYYGSKTDERLQLSGEELAKYRSLIGSGVRGLIQKSYDSKKVSNGFSLSFYNDRGFAYVVNREGNILLRSNGLLGDRLYDDIFDVLSGYHGGQQSVEGLEDALAGRKAGSLVFTGESGSFVYTFVPVRCVRPFTPSFYSFSFESAKDTAGCRALNRNYIVGGAGAERPYEKGVNMAKRPASPLCA